MQKPIRANISARPLIQERSAQGRVLYPVRHRREMTSESAAESDSPNRWKPFQVHAPDQRYIVYVDESGDDSMSQISEKFPDQPTSRAPPALPLAGLEFLLPQVLRHPQSDTFNHRSPVRFAEFLAASLGRR